MSTRALRNPSTLFTLAALTVVAVAIAVVHTQRFAAHADVASWGVTFDLTITIPALYYFFVVRGGRARAMTLAPVFIGCAFVAALIVPRDHQQFLHQLRFAAAPLDLVTLYLIVRRLRATSHATIEEAVRAVFGRTVVASFVATEVSILYHALFCWRDEPRVPGGATAVTVHQRGGWGSMVVCILVLIGFESIGAHLLVSIWSRTAAWIVTSLDVYGILWLIGDYHALRLRPTLITADTIELRYGLRWSVTIARDDVAALDPIKTEADWKRRATLKMAILEEPRILIRLRRPVVAQGLAGIRRTIDAIAIAPDDEASFRAALAR